MKKQLIIRIVLFVLTFFALVGATTFAWMSFTRSSEPIIIYSGSLGLRATFYAANDENYDGIFTDYQLITKAGIEFNRVIPGQIYSFRIIMENLGTIPGNLKLELNSESANKDIAKHLILNYTHNSSRERNLFYNSISDSFNTENNLYSFALFENHLIGEFESATDEYILDFTITIAGTMGSEFFNDTYILTKFRVTLDQIQE